MAWVYYNGDFFRADQPLFSSRHAGVKYGDGVFETIKVDKGRILLSSLHFDRLFTSLQLLQMNANNLSRGELEKRILILCKKNNCTKSARVRLTLFRNNNADCLIEAVPLQENENKWNSEGWEIGIFPFARKSNDAFGNIKSVNYQLYIVAGLYAKENSWDEALVLNAAENIADGSKTNIFLIKNREVFTPALHQGCVNGVMRRFLIDELKKQGYAVKETEISENDLLQADEVFCTNAIKGICWVRKFKNKEYDYSQTENIYNDTILPVYSQ